MKVIFYLIVVLLFPLISFGQITIEQGDRIKNYDSVSYAEQDFDKEEMARYVLDKKLKVRVEAGTVFGSGNYFGTYIAPHLSYRLNERFTLNTGLSLSNNYGGIYYEPYSGERCNISNFSSSLIYAEGAYQVNRNLIITGAVYKEINMFSEPIPGQPAYNNNIEGMIMGVDVKLGKNVYLQGQIEISNGRNPYRRNQFANPVNGLSPNSFNSFNNPF